MKRSISVPEITADLKIGISDEGLRQKYGLSEKGLKTLFEMLLKAMSTGASHIQVESGG